VSNAESRQQLVIVNTFSELDMLCKQQKKVMQYMRVHYNKKGVLKKTSYQYAPDGCILLHCYLGNHIKNTSLFDIAETQTK